MSEQAMSRALDAIHEEATKLLALDLGEEADAIVQTIISLARYKHDVRGRAASVEHVETHERDGVLYEIRVEREEGALWGRWKCPLCGEGGASSKRCTSVDDAVQAATVNIGPHPMFCKKKPA